MKLPDFLEDKALNSLRAQMGADRLGRFEAKADGKRLTIVEIEQLTSKGIDVSIDDVVVLPDGTLAYKDSRVLLYIRDLPQYGTHFKKDLPKFHVANCRTLQDMREKKRWERYVVARRDDGYFSINRISGSSVSGGLEQLLVCQNCLAALGFDGFDYSLSYNGRKAIVNSFSIPIFFDRYPRSLHVDSPLHDSESAPLNQYPDNFDAISSTLKIKRGWRCERCEVHPQINDRRFLHVHHKNGLKYDNRDQNLEVLCLRCHAQEPMHAHLKSLPEYQAFVTKYTSSSGESVDVAIDAT